MSRNASRVLVWCFFVVGFWLLKAPTAQAQITNIDDRTTAPAEGVGHDYVHFLSETVNPANGSVSLRIELPTAKARGFTLPFSLSYDSGSVNHLVPGSGAGYGNVWWSPNFGTLSQGGWSYSVPSAASIQWQASEANSSVGYTCLVWSDFTFRDP